MKIMVINGPNLNMLKYRDKDVYTSSELKNIKKDIIRKYPKIKFKFYQTNYEGKIINYVHKAIIKKYDGIIINPGAYSHYSYAISDALEMFQNYKVEVHFSNINDREQFRKNLITAQNCDEVVIGLSEKGYFKAVEIIINKMEK